jgi:hypothetical protein
MFRLGRNRPRDYGTASITARRDKRLTKRGNRKLRDHDKDAESFRKRDCGTWDRRNDLNGPQERSAPEAAGGVCH